MAIKTIDGGGGTMITGSHINLYAMMSALKVLELEVRTGMQWNRYFFGNLKAQYGLKGNRKKVLEQFREMVEEAKKNAPPPDQD